MIQPLNASSHKNDSILQTPDAKLENTNDLVDMTPKENTGSPKKISLNVEPFSKKLDKTQNMILSFDINFINL